jgi:aminoglycoside phosphotransferase (APT) family kinase protein
MHRRKEMLCRALEQKSRAPVRVSSMQLAVGGNSRESWIADVCIGSDALKLVLRCDPDSWIRPVEMRREIDGLRFAERAGIVAPRILVCSDELDLGRPFVVVDYIEGTAIARRIMRNPGLADARRSFARQCGELLGRIHSATAAAEGWGVRDPIAYAEEHRSQAVYPSPALEGGFAWLVRNRPPASGAQRPVHGDFRLGNLIIGSGGIAAVLDWETCHLGDPDEDLGWLCARAWRYGSELPVGGLGSLAELLETYEVAAGRKVDPHRLHWWTVYADTVWGMVCNHRRPTCTASDAMESGAIARNLCRQEYNVLLELESHVARG